jgi:hypothetical protein
MDLHTQMTDQLETHVTEFLTALNERLQRDQMIRDRAAQIQKPAQGDLDDVRCSIGEYRAVYAESLSDMYERIDAHGSAVLELTGCVNITQHVESLLQSARVEATDVQSLLSRLENATDPLRLFILLAMAINAGFRGLPRQQEIERATADLSVYCLLRFPPSEGP